MHLLLNKYSHC